MKDDLVELELRLSRLASAMERVGDKGQTLILQAMNDIALAVEGEIKPYPPATEANRPGRVNADGKPLGYYERGRGWWYPVMAARQLGAELGKRKGQVRGYKLAGGGLSQKLQAKWTSTAYKEGRGYVAEVGTNVTYAPFVQGSKQPALFNQRGWKTADEVLTKLEPDIVRRLNRLTDELLALL